MNWFSDRKPNDPAKWIIIYPAYINSKKTVAEGRRIPKVKAVDNPTIPEIVETLNSSGLAFHPEPKQYSRERSHEFSVRGRVRVQLKNEDGSLYSQDFPTRDSVMLYLSENIPKLKSRITNPKPTNQKSANPKSDQQSKKKKKGRK